jgi:hypothetical protein
MLKNGYNPQEFLIRFRYRPIIKDKISTFLSFFLSIPGPEKPIWQQLPSWFEQNTPVV